ncbi:MAG: glycosyltransferase family 2 protein [Rhodanobacteraceae bacterium]
MALIRHFPSPPPVAAPVCSVCIANYNGVAIIADCIDSVLAQQGAVPVEIIIHDDASTDGSVEWIRQHYPNVELLAADENAGFCVANNRMVAHARGEYVLLLNNDAALFPDALASLLAAVRAQPQAAILTLPQYDWHTGELVDRGCLLDPFYNPVPNLDPERTDVAYVIGACLWIPRTLWNELGGFPEWMGSLAEDMYLCCAARLRRLSVAVVPASGYRHRQGASFGGNRANAGRLRTTYRRRALSERNKTAVMVICTPTWLVWPLLALHCALLALEGAVLTLVKRDARVWREIHGGALHHTAANFGRLRPLRRDVQRTRRITLGAWLRGFTCVPRKLVLLRRYGLPRVH